MNGEDIKNLADELKVCYRTKNPFVLAEIFGIKTVISKLLALDRKAYIIKSELYPTVIVINGKYTKSSQKVLCAHELGHALLHNEGMNYFAVTRENIHTNVEYEANLFAVALLFEEQEFNVPILEMNNYVLKSILDYNIKESS